MENKKFLENEFVKSFLAVYEQHHDAKEVAKLKERTVGTNGYTVGQIFTLTGEIATKTNEINGTTQVYLILKTKEGAELSLMSLMGVSSLNGYKFDKAYPVEFDVDDEKKTREVKSTMPEKDFSKAWTIPTRNLLELAAMIADGSLPLADKKVTYLGTAVKPYHAKDDGKQNGEEYKAGYARAIETKIWSVK
jgi:hypothetical protein